MPLPAPRVWTDDNTPSAIDLNLDWRDSFDFLLGNTRPIIYVRSNVAQTLVANVTQNVNWQQELIKRGGMTHSTNSATITVPYTGQYVGFAQGGIGSMASTSTRFVCFVIVNGTAKCRWDEGPTTTAGMEIAGSFSLSLAANDAVTLGLRNSITAPTTTIGLNQPRFAMWYAGDAV